MEKENSADAAKRLNQNKNEIMQRWEKLVRSEFSEAEKESKLQLIDSLPELLDQLADALKHSEVTQKDYKKIQQTSLEHAEDRAAFTRYTIEHILREYELLRKIIFEMLETDRPLSVTPRDIIVNFIQTAQKIATIEFAEIIFEKERGVRTKLEEKEQVFKTIFELAAAGKAIVDILTGRFLQVNRRLCEMLGYTNEELLQKTTLEISHPDDIDILINRPPKDLADIADGKAWTIEKRYIHKDGTPIWVMISGALYPLKDNQSPRIIATIFDITDKKQIENLKDQFINTLTHDLRTPLSVIDMSAQLLHAKSADANMVLKLSDRIMANVKRCDSMIQDLLDTSRIRSGHGVSLQVEHCDLAKIIQETVDGLVSVHGDRFIVTGPTSLTGFWSARGIQRILENLCNNAVKYGAKNFPIVISYEDAGEQVMLSVNNRGEPIPKENMSTLFQQFSRTRSAEASGKMGWGIGLTIVKGITEAHCGEITVTSNEQDGTTFTVKLPQDPRPCHDDRHDQRQKT